MTKGSETVWDSGEVHSANSANVAYGGPALDAATQYAFKVRVWDEASTPSEWSTPASFETGLLSKDDFAAKWIAAPADDLNLAGVKWIWSTNEDGTGNLPAMTRYLRATVNLAAKPGTARFLFTVDDEAVVYVNGTQVIDTKTLRDNDENAWQKAQIVDVTNLLSGPAARRATCSR